MKSSSSVRKAGNRSSEMRGSAALISFAVIMLLLALWGPRSYERPVSSMLLTLVLAALGAAIILHVRFMMLARHEQRETVRVLDATEREFQSIFDSALDGILILDHCGTCLEANAAALSLLGTSRKELVGQSIREFLVPAEEFENAWKRFLDHKHQHGEVQLVGQHGAQVFVEYSAKADYLPGRHLAVLRDISRRKQAEAALRESDERYQEMANNIQEIYWMVDAVTKQLIYVNPAYETVTGRSLATLRDNPTSYQETFHPEDRVRILTKLEEASQTGQFDEEFRIVRPDRVWFAGFRSRLRGARFDRRCSQARGNFPRYHCTEIRRGTDGQESGIGRVRLGRS